MLDALNITVKTFSASQTTGNDVLIFGRVHGNEPCGTVAIENVIKRIETNSLKLKDGSVTFVPICNPEAAKADTREMDENLNRIFQIHNDPKTYEQYLANALCPLIAKHDFFLDIHSTLRESDPFSIAPSANKLNPDIVSALGCNTHIYSNRDSIIDTTIRPSNASTVYANAVGTPSIVVECGQHENKNAAKTAEQAIMNVLGHHNIIDAPPAPIGNTPTEIFNVTGLYFNDEVKRYSAQETPAHMRKFMKDAPIAELHDGRIIQARIDNTRVLFPNAGQADGQAAKAEQFYVAEPYAAHLG